MKTTEYLSALLGVEPATIARPTAIDEISAVVTAADRDGQAVIPWGGGTAQAYGYLPRRADVLLDLSGLNRVIAHEPGDLIVTVEGGATLADLQETLARHNQFLPLDPPEPERATIGGILATDAFGPSRTHYGTARDWLIGIMVVDPQGRVVKGGGKVVKNVTGYDLPKLHVGALGTLGVIVEATFKVAPRPDASQALLFALPPDESLHEDRKIAATLALITGETAPALGLLRDQADARIAAFIYSGTTEVVASQREKAAQIALNAAGDMVEIASLPPGVDRPFTAEPPPVDALLILRIAGPPADEYARHAAITPILGPDLLRIDTFPGSGQSEVMVGSSADPIAVGQKLAAWAHDLGSRVAVLSAPAAMRQANAGFPLWSPLPPSFPLMRRLKEVLDPNGTLNPGRFVGGL